MEHQRHHLDRAHGEIETGFAEVAAPHSTRVHTAAHAPPPEFLLRFEDARPMWLMELIAEAVGVFLYVYLGVGATASFYVNQAARPPVAGFGAILNIGFSYACGIIFALVCVAGTSGGHLNPCFTIAFTLFRGFPLRKVLPYIIAQLTGAYVAALLVYLQYKQQLDLLFTEFSSSATTSPVIFTNQGPPGVLALFIANGQNIGYVFVAELFCTIIIGILVFSVLDPSNLFVSFASAPFLIGIIYGAVIWAFADLGLALNTARDLGGRFACATIWGHRCFTYQPGYTALAALTNIAGTLIGAAIQIFLLGDSGRPITMVPPTVDAEPQNAPSLRAISREPEKYTTDRKGNGNGSGTSSRV